MRVKPNLYSDTDSSLNITFKQFQIEVKLKKAEGISWRRLEDDGESKIKQINQEKGNQQYL